LIDYFSLQLIILLILFCIAWIDVHTYCIPNQAILGLVFLFIPALFCTPYPPSYHLLGFILALLLSFTLKKVASYVLKKEALGWGDVKLMAVGGLWLGLNNLPFFLILSGLCGIGTWVILNSQKTIFPFGPSLCIAWTLIWGWEILVISQGF
jgi:leader peptidase (prepilin peptidase)/N-methyltransferase